MKSHLKLLAYFFAAMLLISISPIPFSEAENEDSAVQLLCLNIGKADCMLLFAEDKTYLIDSGYEHTWPALQTALEEFSVTRLDGVFLTHTHVDHEGALEKLAQSSMEIAAWYASDIFHDVKPSKHPMVKAAQIRDEEVTWLHAGDVIPISDTASFTVLGPLSKNQDNENNNSLVLHLETQEGDILFTGDMKEEEEQELLLSGVFKNCDLLKVAHHGDNKTTSQAFLNAVSPEVSVILTSTIEEPDTPAYNTLKRLKAAGSDIYVSQDAQDALLFKLRDHQVSVQDYRWQHAPLRLTGIEVSMDVHADILTIKNTADHVITLEGAFLHSTKGNDTFPLPVIPLKPDGEYTIGSQASEKSCDFTASKKRIWHENKRDVALLYDAYGRMLGGTDNGIED